MPLLILLCTVLTLAACDRHPSGPQTAFSGQQALGYVKTQLDFGPRIPGTEAARRTGDWITAQMRQRADTVIEQRWTHVTAKRDSLPMRNILARFRPQESQRVLYVTHWDTRPQSTSESDPALRRMPVPGANDGASGVALFIALADVLKKTPPSYGVDLLFVDGEDYGEFGPPMVDVLIGATYFADHLPSPGYQPIFGILWDMIGDSDLKLYQEGHSVEHAPEIVARVWQTAQDLGYSRYFPSRGIGQITDDHVPLIAKGLRVIDVIDLDYDYHHRHTDTLDKVSAASLQIVGDVATALVTGK
jgi:glutaminyl-peptide cyclotransferase